MTRYKPTWVGCSRCSARMSMPLIAGVPLYEAAEYLNKMTCMCCGANANHLHLDPIMTLDRDRQFRNVSPDAPIEDRCRDWMVWGTVCRPSATLVNAITGFWALDDRSTSGEAPRNTAELRRILLAMDRMPELRAGLFKVADLSPSWERFVRSFDEIERDFIEDAGSDLAGDSDRTRTALLLTHEQEAGTV